MPNKSKRSPSADEIAEMATRGEDVSEFFTNQFTVVRPVRRVNVDLTQGMLRELDERAARLNVSRQAVIKTCCGMHWIMNGQRGRRGAGERANRGRSRRLSGQSSCPRTVNSF